MKKFSLFILTALLMICFAVSAGATGTFIPGPIVSNTPPAINLTDGVAPTVTGMTVTEYSSGIVQQTIFTFDDVALAVTDEAGVVAYTGQEIYAFGTTAGDDGAILFLGATADLALTKSSAGVNDDWDGDFGIGTVTAANDASLTSTEDNLLPTTATPQASAGATTATGQSTATENVVIDATGGDDVYINFLIDDADQDVTTTACNLILNGTVTLTWINLGDY